MRKIFFGFGFLVFTVGLSAQTTVNYRFDVTDEGIFLIERVEKTVAGSPRKQVIETPVFFIDTIEVSNYLAGLSKQQIDLEAQIKAAVSENEFLKMKTKVIINMADSLFFKPKIVAKND